MYKKSKITGKIYLDEILIPFDDTNELYIDFADWLNLNNSPELFDGTPEEIEYKAIEQQKEYFEKLTQVVNFLDKRLLISSISKEETDIEYLKNQTPRYYEKYKVAKRYIETANLPDPIITDQEWYNQIVKELDNTNAIQGANITVSQFMGLIVQYYEYGDYRNKIFQTTLEYFRAKTKDFIITKNYTKADLCMDLANTLPDAMSLEDLENKVIQFDAI